MKTIDFNCDIGESIGTKIIGDDAGVMPFISSANIACGFHGGDPNVMNNAILLAMKHGVAVGAHPSFQDPEGFGRREMNISPIEIYHLMAYQISAIKGMTELNGGILHHVKPHGALYNMAARSMEISDAIVMAIKKIDPGLILYGLANSKLIEAGNKNGLLTCSEVFADRTYQDDGSLTPRTHEGALIKNIDDSIEQVASMVLEKRVKTINGNYIEMKAETICIHGDHSGAIELAKQLHGFFIKKNIIIKPPSSQKDI